MVFKLNRKKKILIGIATVLLVLVIIAGNIVANKYKKIIYNTLPGAVRVASDGLYHISVKNVSVNILTRSVTLKEVHLWPDSSLVAQKGKDSTAKANYFDIHIPKLRVSAIMWDKLTGGAGFSCGTFAIVQPEITIYKTDPALTIYDTIKKEPVTKDFTARKLKIQNADIRYLFMNGQDTNLIQFNKCSVTLKGWQYNPDHLKNPDKFLMSEYGNVNIGSVQYSPPFSFYKISCSNVQFNSEDNKLTARDMRYKLRIPEQAFYDSVYLQKGIYDLHFPILEFDGIDRNRFVQQQELSISTIYLNHSKVDISLDRRYPENNGSKLGKFPNQVLQKLRLPVYVKQIKINDASVTYTEVSDKTNKKASLYFDNIDGSLSNITNIDQATSADSICVANLICKFNRYTNVTALFRFSLTDKQGGFEMDARLGGLQSHQLTEQTKAFSMLEIKSLNMRSLNMQLKGNEDSAGSDFTMLYNNLGIRILKEERNLMGDKKKKGFLSFIANSMILYSNNPMPGAKARTVYTHVKRDSTKSFFNLIWKNILQGVRETTIRDMEVIEWIRKNEIQKKKQENVQLKGLFKKDRKRIRGNRE